MALLGPHRRDGEYSSRAQGRIHPHAVFFHFRSSLLQKSAVEQDYFRVNDASSGERSSGLGDNVIVIEPLAAAMDTSLRSRLSQIWFAVRNVLFPEIEAQTEQALTPKPEQLIDILECT